ncbi:MAG: ribosome-associated translation inhibitor RaiA [Patescibacteria group bacterium]|nr:ribosome-associated translation inhibitor RaiA [Patescibacteria group bacterium]MCL5224153.1 ribosome-associated translation inhibitor RaiA [Patescibacteria group bacterium]
MNISVKATNISLTTPLKEYIDEKIGGLEHLLARVDTSTVKAVVEVGRDSKHHQKGDVYRAEVNIELPDGMLRAEHSDWDVRIAIDSVRDKLRREIEKYLDRHGKDHRGESRAEQS